MEAIKEAHKIDPAELRDLDKEALAKAREEKMSATKVNLGMVKVSPEFADKMKQNYQDYVDSLPEDQKKPFKADYYGTIMEGAFNLAGETIESKASTLANEATKAAQLYNDTKDHLKQAEEHLNESKKSTQKNWLILIAFTMISALVIFLLYRMNSKKDE